MPRTQTHTKHVHTYQRLQLQACHVTTEANAQHSAALWSTYIAVVGKSDPGRVLPQLSLATSPAPRVSGLMSRGPVLDTDIQKEKGDQNKRRSDAGTYTLVEILGI